MQRDEAETVFQRVRDNIRRRADFLERCFRRRGSFETGVQRVDHDVADEGDGFRRNAFLQKIVDRRAFGGEEEIGKTVRDEAVDFLGHGSVVAAQARLDMRERNAELRGDERGGDGRIHIADDKEKIGPSRHEDRLEF